MQWQLVHLPDLGILEFSVSGTMTLDGIRDLVTAGVAASARHGTNRILVDYRAIDLNLSAFDIYGLPDIERSIGGNRNRVAMIMPATTEAQRDFQFYENRAVNTGTRRAVFRDRDAALAWLADGS